MRMSLILGKVKKIIRGSKNRDCYILLFLLMFLTAAVSAEIPKLMNIQGQLKDKNGSPIAVSTLVRFEIFQGGDEQTGGVLVFQEDATVQPNQQGIFTHLIGSGGIISGKLDEETFNTDTAYLQITMNPATAPDVLKPRQRLVSVSYAFQSEKAKTVEDNAITTENIKDNAVTPQKLSDEVTKSFMKVSTEPATAGMLIFPSTIAVISASTPDGQIILKSDTRIEGQVRIPEFLFIGEGTIQIGGTAGGAANTISFTAPPGPALGRIQTTGGLPLNINDQATSVGNINVGNANTPNLNFVGDNLNINSDVSINLNTISNQPITTGTGLTTFGGSVRINSNNILDSLGSTRLTLGDTTVISSTVTITSTATIQGGNLYVQEGNVGIGTTEPGNMLHIQHPTNPIMRLDRNDSDILPNETLGEIAFYGQDINIIDSDRWGASIRAVAGNIWGASAEAHSVIQFLTRRNELESPNVKMVINQNGNVGIGTTNPGSARLAIMNGNVGIGTTSPSSTLHLHSGSTGNSILFSNDYLQNGTLIGLSFGGDTLIWNREAGKQIRLATRNIYGIPSDGLTVDENGNVGIMQQYPQYTLEVKGTGRFSGFLTKSGGGFLIDHPNPDLSDNYYLVHGFIEGEEHGVMYRGEAVLTDGKAVVSLPDYFEYLVNESNVTIQLTCKDGWTPLYVDGKVTENKFKVKTTPNGNKSQEFYWQVQGTRKDSFVLTDKHAQLMGTVLKTDWNEKTK